MVTVGVLDSGVGGLSVLKEILKLVPGGRFIYYSDNANCPYGEKTPEFIQDRCREIVRMMVSKGAQVVVVACNTATAAAISVLRSEFDIPFIGMEPAVKPAALGTKTGVIGVLATAGTLKGSKYLTTRGRFEDDVRIEEHVGRGFVELVESGELESPHAEEVVAASLRPLLVAGADTIVLGCTHYPFLLPVMRKIAGDGINFIDPAPAVARQLVKVMEQSGITTAEAEVPANPSEVPDDPAVELVSSGSSDALRRTFSLIR